MSSLLIVKSVPFSSVAFAINCIVFFPPGGCILMYSISPAGFRLSRIAVPSSETPLDTARGIFLLSFTEYTKDESSLSVKYSLEKRSGYGFASSSEYVTPSFPRTVFWGETRWVFGLISAFKTMFLLTTTCFACTVKLALNKMR